MKIAVTYQNGEIFQHFGHSEQFGIYETENGKVVNKTVIGTEGSGHGALATLLSEQGVDTLICGGMVTVPPSWAVASKERSSSSFSMTV